MTGIRKAPDSSHLMDFKACKRCIMNVAVWVLCHFHPSMKEHLEWLAHEHDEWVSGSCIGTTSSQQPHGNTRKTFNCNFCWAILDSLLKVDKFSLCLRDYNDHELGPDTFAISGRYQCNAWGTRIEKLSNLESAGKMLCVENYHLPPNPLTPGHNR